MKIVADFHIHSKYSRATSPDMNLENLNIWAKKKGINVMGTGDFTHPLWFKEIQEKLEPAEPGLFVLKNDKQGTRFILTVEISSIYSKNGKVRRIHNLVFLPSFESAEKFNNRLSLKGNLKADGRPILGLDAKELLKIALNADEKSFFVPAHAWTPWFSIFGSMSGFDSIEECFDELSPNIRAIETGLSSSPEMNWRLSKLDKIALISNSDSHSPQRIGREANVFNCDPDYFSIIEAIKSKNPEKFLYTIEFFPEEGKYHFDGHRNCNIRFSPEETKKHNGICPVCGKPVTAGVMNRINKLADPERPDGFQLENAAIPCKKTVPLDEIIADTLGVGAKSKRVMKEYDLLIEKIGGEINILIDEPIEKISEIAGPRIAEAISRVRQGKLVIQPGYDGEYGKIKIFRENEEIETQKSLF
ncbi:MAG: DNA helicase UvrD [Candidatus Niyogibacteria bacterium RIFCSPLOWO2_12_FULL_41_13]|uniref:DNA helicase UvrD n=1 Tax=Candidatus Niyogibacteria bacterium RIFCSPLOWO2_12_FULL_41_13 TaxID=1801726 RepID=A0A1G2F3W4_9BACT|nr:MAG: DNA helicase UvrD [Candidatus Niyogibacteria bacterium RIFCSPLOWO2_12_FULL_41_13]